MEVREELARVFARPRSSWAAHLIEPSPAELATDLERAILKSANNWWCDGRWWVTGCTCILCWAQLCKRAKHSDRALLCLPCLWLVSEHMWGSWASVQRGLWAPPAAATDSRVRHAARRARLQGTRNFPPEEARVATAFQADESPGRHAARICASVKALKGVHSSRYDAEGVARTLTWKLSLTSPAKSGRNASHRKRRNS